MDDPSATGWGAREVAVRRASPGTRSCPSILQECSFGGHAYASCPSCAPPRRAYVNHGLWWRQLGYELPDVLTWDFLWEVADTAAEKDDGRRLQAQRPAGHDSRDLQVHRQHDDPAAAPVGRRAIPTGDGAMCFCSATRRRHCCSPSPIRCGRARSPRSRFPAIPPISSTRASACSPSTPPRAPHGWARTRR